MKRRTLLIALSATSCATRQSVSDGSSLTSNQGLLAMKLASNAIGSISFVPHVPETPVASRPSESVLGSKGTIAIKELEQYFVLPVDAGQYMWSRFSAFSRHADLRSSNRFEIKSGTITYIGHIRFFVRYKELSIDVFDKPTEMQDHLREHFPRYYETLRFEKFLTRFRVKEA